MKLKEYQGKRLFEAYGISIPMGFVISKKSLEGNNNNNNNNNDDDDDDNDNDNDNDNNNNMSQIHERLDFLKNNVILKAQILEGEQKKEELIIKSDDKEFAKNALNMFRKIGDNEILVEESLEPKMEIFCSLSISEADKAPVLTVSEKNSISEKNNLSEKNKNCRKLVFKNLNNEKLVEFAKDFPVPDALIPVIFNMYRLMVDKDCTLIEINPLAVVSMSGDDRLIALDSKIVVDDNALFRQEAFRKLKELNEDIK